MVGILTYFQGKSRRKGGGLKCSCEVLGREGCDKESWLVGFIWGYANARATFFFSDDDWNFDFCDLAHFPFFSPRIKINASN